MEIILLVYHKRFNHYVSIIVYQPLFVCDAGLFLLCAQGGGGVEVPLRYMWKYGHAH